MSNIGSVLAFNREFVAFKGYEPHITDRFPDKHLAVLSCMDKRLSVLLQEALGFKSAEQTDYVHFYVENFSAKKELRGLFFVKFTR